MIRRKIRLLKDLRLFILDVPQKDFVSMCDCISDMHWLEILPEKEILELKKYLKDNGPVKTMLWFDRGLKKPRVDWIDQQLHKLERKLIVSQSFFLLMVVIVSIFSMFFINDLIQFYINN